MIILTYLWPVAGLCVPFSSACTPDWRTQSGLSALVVWLFVNPFVHLGGLTGDLTGDLPFFIFVASLVESWMVRIRRKVRYFILLAAYVISMMLNLYLYLHGKAEAGSSVMIYALVPVAWYYLIKFYNASSRFWSSLILIVLTWQTLSLDFAILITVFQPSGGYSISLLPVYPSFVHSWGLLYGLMIVAGYLVLLRDGGIKLESNS